MATLVVVHASQTHFQQTLRQLVTFATAWSERLIVAVTGYDCAQVATDCAIVNGVDAVWHIDAPELEHGFADTLVTALVQACDASVTHIIFNTDSLGKDVMPRLAAKLPAEPLSDVIIAHNANTFSRPIYAGNAISKVKVDAPRITLTVRANRFKAAALTIDKPAPITAVACTLNPSQMTFVQFDAQRSSRPELAQAKVVVSGGRGLQSKAQFVLVEQLADALNAAVGASRAAVDAGFAPNDTQVGQTGKTVAPDLYIAVGISGAIQHVAGIKDSKVIVAINNDANAPIFSIADYAWVGDCFKLIPEMIALLTGNAKTNGG